MSSACPEYGFEFSFSTAAAMPDAATHALWAEFVETVERLGLAAGGGARETHWHHVITGVGTQATDQDRQALLAWAESRSEIHDAAAGPLIDLNAAPATLILASGLTDRVRIDLQLPN